MLNDPPFFDQFQRLLKSQLPWLKAQNNKGQIRDCEYENIQKILRCGSTDMGSAFYKCPHEGCTHSKFVNFTCKSRACPSCGKKATTQWIHQQLNSLPQTEYQHITFTMPKTLWRLFALNRKLLGNLCQIAAKVIKDYAKKHKITPAIFLALHTFGRDLQWNPHAHASTTRGGLTENYEQWKPIYFKKDALMKAWRYQICKLLSETYTKGELMLPDSLQAHCPTAKEFNRWLKKLLHRPWIVHCAKPSKSHWRNVNYLGRYIKRPPMAMSRLKHYDGKTVMFNYLDHRTKNHKMKTLDITTFIRRFIQHIPEHYFHVIRYYGLLANRVRSPH